MHLPAGEDFGQGVEEIRFVIDQKNPHGLRITEVFHPFQVGGIFRAFRTFAIGINDGEKQLIKGMGLDR